MSDTLESVEFSFWTKCVLCLQIAKEAFHNYVKDTWNKYISSWSDEEISSIEQFVDHVNERTAKFKYVDRSASKTKSVGWKCTCCESCEKVFKKLLLNQQNPESRNIAWKCNRKVSSVQEQKPIEAQKSSNRIIKDGVEFLFWQTDKGFYVEVRNNRNGNDSRWNPEGQQTSQVKTFDYYWSMINVFMCKSADDIQCPCPEETDISMFFNMMKNCILFSLKQESFRYDQVLAARNQLMHSPRLQVTRLEMESIFGNTKALLMLFQKVDDCMKAVETIEKLLLKELLIFSTDHTQNLEFKQHTKAALEIRVRELGIDITIAKNMQVDASLLEEPMKITENYLQRIENVDHNSSQFENVIYNRSAENQEGAESDVKEYHGARPKLSRGRTSTENIGRDLFAERSEESKTSEDGNETSATVLLHKPQACDLEQENIVPYRGQSMPKSNMLFKDDDNEKDKKQSEDKRKSRSQYDTKRISPWKIDQEGWRHCTESKTLVEFNEEGRRLLTEYKIPNDNLLGIIFKRSRGKEILNEICDAVCEYIKQTNENIIKVWAGYEYNNNNITIGYKVIFVVITKCSRDITNDDFTVICRGFYEISCKDENLELQRREREHPPKYKKKQLAKQALRKCAPALMKKHKQLNRATISWMKYTIGEPLTSGIQKCMCIALYVQVRGVVPIDEEPFPKILEGLPVDVREGLIKPCKGPKEHHKHLKIGCEIRGSAFVGTLGPFLKFQKRETEQYVLTCAHIFGHDILKGYTQSGIKKKVYQPGTTGTDEKEFGEVVLVKEKQGRNGLAGMEIALIQVHERHPTSGKFPDAPNYADAGFGPELPFTFTSGEVLPVSALKTHCIVWKYGCETQLTKGEIRVDGSSVRTRTLTSINTEVEITLNGQIEVESSGNMSFASAGDSGALVLTVSKSTGQLAAVGMLEGKTADGTCYLVTPLVDVLNELATETGSECYLNKYPQYQNLHHMEIEAPNTTENEFVPLTSRFEKLENKFAVLKQHFDNHKEEIKQELASYKMQMGMELSKFITSQQASIREVFEQQDEKQQSQYLNITQMLEKILQSGNDPNFNAQN